MRGLRSSLVGEFMIKIVMLLSVALSFPLCAAAVVYGGSNLGFGGYPSMSCNKPQKPYKPYSFNNQWEVDTYNSQVNEYNEEYRQYISCVKEYVDNAQNDINRIKEKVQDAIYDVKH